MTHKIHTESCLLHVSARASIWKPLLKPLQRHWGNTPPRWRKKKHQMESVKQLNAICSLHLRVFFSSWWSSLRAHGKGDLIGGGFFVISEKSPAHYTHTALWCVYTWSNVSPAILLKHFFFFFKFMYNNNYLGCFEGIWPLYLSSQHP